MSDRNLEKQSSEQSLDSSSGRRPLSRGYSSTRRMNKNNETPESNSGQNEKGSKNGKNFNSDGTSSKEFNRDGSARSIGKEKSIRFNKLESPSKSPKSQEVISSVDIDHMIKSVSSKELGDEIDDFIDEIENDISKNGSRNSIPRSPMRKTKKNSDRRLGESGDYDRYGFLVTKPVEGAFVLTTEQSEKMLKKEDGRTDKWIYMLNHWDLFSLKRFGKVKSRVRKGIPDAVRGEVWYRLAHVDDMKALFPLALDLEDVESRLDTQVNDEIGRDVNRTFPSHRLFNDGGPGQEALRRVLQRYALLDPAIGYCQGMGFLAALLLQYLHEHDAFYAMVSLMNRPSLPFRGMYSPGMEDTKKVLAVFAVLAEIKIPKLWNHLVSAGVHHSMFVTSWIMTIFISGFSFEFAVRVWDILWVEGWKIVYKVCIALLKYSQNRLLSMSMEEILLYFRHLPLTMDADKVWKTVWTIKLSQDEVSRCEDWYQEENS